MRKHVKYYVTIILLLHFTGCLKDDNFKNPYTGFSPQSRNDGWVISTPENENISRASLDKAYRLIYDDERFTMARSMLIIRNGRLVAEAYPHDNGDIDRIANIQSITKSFTSILTGIAIEKNIIDSVTQTFSSIYPEHFSVYPEKSSITIKHALTMTTGIDFDNDEDTESLYHAEGSSVESVLSEKMIYDPGVVFHYHDGAPHLVSAAIQKRFGKSLSEFSNQYLLSPLGITNWQWESASDGVTFGAFSLFLKPRDLAKFGQLLIQNGKWKGVQLVDSAWIAEATQPVVNSESGGGPYGYYFWIYPAYGAYVCIGHGGQRVMIFPDKNLVIVYTAWGYTEENFFDQFNEVTDLILNGCD